MIHLYGFFIAYFLLNNAVIFLLQNRLFYIALQEAQC